MNPVHTPAPAAPLVGQEEVVRVVTTLLCAILGTDPGSVRPDESLEALDIDSIVIVELILGIQKELGVRVELGRITPQDTVTSAAAVVAGLLAAREEAVA